jgi:hypothetical protein
VRRIELETGDITNGEFNGDRTYFSLAYAREKYEATLKCKELATPQTQELDSLPTIEVNRSGRQDKFAGVIKKLFVVSSTPRLQIAGAGLQLARDIQLSQIDDPEIIIVGRCQAVLCGYVPPTGEYRLSFFQNLEADEEILKILIDQNRLGTFKLFLDETLVFSAHYTPYVAPFAKLRNPEANDLWNDIHRSRHTGKLA